MRTLFIISFYTIFQNLKKKSFWISNLIIALLILLCFSILGSNNFNTNVSNNNSINIENLSEEEIKSIKSQLPLILFVDSYGFLENYQDILDSSEYNIIIDNSLSMDEIKSKVNNEQIYCAVILSEIENNISFDYIVKESNSYNETDAHSISLLLEKIQTTKLLNEFGLSQNQINKINDNIKYEIIETNSNDFNSTIIVSMLLSFILFLAIYLYGHTISSSIASEKTSKIIESLVTSAKPKHIILGKTLGMGILGLLQLVFLGIVSILCYTFFMSSNFEMPNSMFGNINITTTNTLLMLIYFLLGYTLFAFLNAIAGSTISKPEDLQIANMPISIISLLCFYLVFFTSDITSGDFYNFTSLFPFCSPFAMPGKILNGFASSAEIGASLIILLLSIILLAFISIRIYSISILHYGNRLKIKDIFNLFIKIR